MPSRPRKSSRQVALVLVGAATLFACGQGERTLRRDVYASKGDCVADWGDEVKCEQSPAALRSGIHGGYWYGPAYRSGHFGSGSNDEAAGVLAAPRPGSHAVATSQISRGGFGATGAAHAVGGG